MKPLKIIFLFFISIVLNMDHTQAQDWPNLERYQKENAALDHPISDENRVVFMGNSITEGWSNDSTSFFQTNPQFINRGISGQTTPQMLVRFRQDVVDLKPAVVIILAGINDIAENTGPATVKMMADNIFSMVEIAQANNIKVVLCSVLPANRFPWRERINPVAKVAQLNATLKAYAQEHQLVYCDYFSAMVDEKEGLREDLGYDGVHPNKAGYSIMEPLALAAIQEALGK